MSKHFRTEIDGLKKKLLSLSAVVEESVRQAVRAVQERSTALAQQVIESDYQIDLTEVEVEEDCLKILALYQPVAGDLRFIVAVLKINNDLERIGDLAVNIAERAAFLAMKEPVDIPFDFPGMAEKAQAMLRKSLDALVNLDPALAREVCIADDEVDEINRAMYKQVKDGIRRHLSDLTSLIHLLNISCHLERIADLATNIAEDVIYMVEGQIIRHRTEDYSSDSPRGTGPEGPSRENEFS